jgi:peptidoglycan biosynthesis protein MviN/MurJ (putative lipid II flippase)
VSQLIQPLVCWPVNKSLAWTWAWVVEWAACLVHQKAAYLAQKPQWAANQKVMHLQPLMQPQAAKQN